MHVYQVHGDGVGSYKLGSIYQPICPSNLNSVTFGRWAEADAVPVLQTHLNKY